MDLLSEIKNKCYFILGLPSQYFSFMVVDFNDDYTYEMQNNALVVSKDHFKGTITKRDQLYIAVDGHEYTLIPDFEGIFL